MHLSTIREYFFYLPLTTHKPHFIYNLISSSKQVLVSILEHIIIYHIIFNLLHIIMATMDITESGFQTPASKKRKASGSPSLPPASQPTRSPSTYKNKTPLIATGIDPKFITPIQIMSELRQYHPSLRVLQIKETKNGWIFIGDTPKDLNIPQSKAKMKQVSGQKLRSHYQGHITLQTPQKVKFWFSREYL